LPAQVYNIKATIVKPKADDYADLFQAKKLADEMGGVRSEQTNGWSRVAP
jgi:hypothetical protein